MIHVLSMDLFSRSLRDVNRCRNAHLLCVGPATISPRPRAKRMYKVAWNRFCLCFPLCWEPSSSESRSRARHKLGPSGRSSRELQRRSESSGSLGAGQSHREKRQFGVLRHRGKASGRAVAQSFRRRVSGSYRYADGTPIHQDL
jgi:hypothetical protein